MLYGKKYERFKGLQYVVKMFCAGKTAHRELNAAWRANHTVTASSKFEIHFSFLHSIIALMKRRSSASTQTTRLFSQKSSADPFVTFL